MLITRQAYLSEAEVAADESSRHLIDRSVESRTGSPVVTCWCCSFAGYSRCSTSRAIERAGPTRILRSLIECKCLPRVSSVGRCKVNVTPKRKFAHVLLSVGCSVSRGTRRKTSTFVDPSALRSILLRNRCFVGTRPHWVKRETGNKS